MAEVESAEAAAVLDLFKKMEKDRGEVIHPLVRDPILRNLVVVWTLHTVEFHPPKGKPPEVENQRWKWLWQNVKYDKDAISEYLKLDRMKISRLIDTAIAFRLIYPDGTANTLAIQYVRGDIARSLQTKPGPKAPKP